MKRIIILVGIILISIGVQAQDCKSIKVETDKITGESIRGAKFDFNSNVSLYYANSLQFRVADGKPSLIVEYNLRNNVEAAVQLDDKILIKPEDGEAVELTPLKTVEPVSRIISTSTGLIMTSYEIEYAITMDDLSKIGSSPIRFIRLNVDKPYDHKLSKKKAEKLRNAAYCLTSGVL
ncbi:MAG: hypothetical protein MRY83_00305 [Flavobacteriales bacterium]|nr:hypothetical protein [Flavobacteriales bacterium]